MVKQISNIFTIYLASIALAISFSCFCMNTSEQGFEELIQGLKWGNIEIMRQVFTKYPSLDPNKVRSGKQRWYFGYVNKEKIQPLIDYYRPLKVLVKIVKAGECYSLETKIRILKFLLEKGLRIGAIELLFLFNVGEKKLFSWLLEDAFSKQCSMDSKLSFLVRIIISPCRISQEEIIEVFTRLMNNPLERALLSSQAIDNMYDRIIDYVQVKQLDAYTHSFAQNTCSYSCESRALPLTSLGDALADLANLRNNLKIILKRSLGTILTAENKEKLAGTLGKNGALSIAKILLENFILNTSDIQKVVDAAQSLQLTGLEDSSIKRHAGENLRLGAFLLLQYKKNKSLPFINAMNRYLVIVNLLSIQGMPVLSGNSWNYKKLPPELARLVALYNLNEVPDIDFSLMSHYTEKGLQEYLTLFKK